jgi:hypothetical protein
MLKGHQQSHRAFACVRACVRAYRWMLQIDEKPHCATGQSVRLSSSIGASASVCVLSGGVRLEDGATSDAGAGEAVDAPASASATNCSSHIMSVAVVISRHADSCNTGTHRPHTHTHTYSDQ